MRQGKVRLMLPVPHLHPHWQPCTKGLPSPQDTASQSLGQNKSQLQPQRKREPPRSTHAASQTHHLLVWFALRASLGLPGLLNVFSCEAPYGGLVLVEESSLDAIGQEQVSGISKKPSIDSAHWGGGLS